MEDAHEIKADFMTLGGGLILAVTIVATLFLIMSLLVPVVDRLQLAIIAMLAGACWLYMINRFSEKLKLEEGHLEFDTALGRKQIFNLDEVMGLRLTDLGWSLNGNFYLLEISVYDKRRPLQIGLGPCWRRSDLAGFVGAIGKKLENQNQIYAD
ncbi:MAG: hypothetical protein PHC70_02255 [Patescibacteria group bacterium]|nr:hypothetical protein [Patescibacteria group bacterium]